MSNYRKTLVCSFLGTIIYFVGMFLWYWYTIDVAFLECLFIVPFAIIFGFGYGDGELAACTATGVLFLIIWLLIFLMLLFIKYVKRRM